MNFSFNTPDNNNKNVNTIKLINFSKIFVNITLKKTEYDRQYDFRIAAKSIQSDNAVYGQEAVFKISTSTSKLNINVNFLFVF